MIPPFNALRHVPGSSVVLVRANQFPLSELTTAYNQARVDYLVPMQMNAARLADYIRVYDVDLRNSWVAVEDGEMLGLAMLGVRPGRTWITRLGVLPKRRRRGTGEVLVQALREDSTSLGCALSVLEVIQGNAPARDLFRKAGYQENRELIVLRRPPGPVALDAPGQGEWMEQKQAVALLRGLPGRRPWTNEVESYQNAGDASGLAVHLENGGQGWVIFRRQEKLLSHFVLHTAGGSPEEVATALLAHLFHRFPRVGAYLENIPADDPHLKTLLRLGFVEVFRRIEMVSNS